MHLVWHHRSSCMHIGILHWLDAQSDFIIMIVIKCLLNLREDTQNVVRDVVAGVLGVLKSGRFRSIILPCKYVNNVINSYTDYKIMFYKMCKNISDMFVLALQGECHGNKISIETGHENNNTFSIKFHKTCSEFTSFLTNTAFSSHQNNIFLLQNSAFFLLSRKLR